MSALIWRAVMIALFCVALVSLSASVHVLKALQSEPLIVEEIPPFLTLAYGELIHPFRVSPNQEYVGITTELTTLRVISLISGDIVAELTSDNIRPDITWSPDGLRFLTNTGVIEDGFEIRDVTGQLVATGTHPELRELATWGADGSTIFFTFAERFRGPEVKDIGMWDTASGQLLHSVGEAGNITFAAVNPSNTLLAKLGGRDRWEIWRLTNPPELAIQFESFGGSDHFAFSDDPNYVYINGRVWNAATGTPEFDETFRVPDGSLALIGKERILSTAFRQVISIDLTTSEPSVAVDFNDNVWGKLYAHDFSRVLTIHDDHLSIWDMSTGELQVVLKTPTRVFDVFWDSEQNLLTATRSNLGRFSVRGEPALLWRWDLSPEAIASGEIVILPTVVE